MFSKYILNVPSNWIFEYYLHLNTPLIGQRIKIKSIFNIKDTNPSMYIYYDGKSYKYKCFSTGQHGGSLELVAFLYNINIQEAFDKIVYDYKYNRYTKPVNIINTSLYKEKTIIKNYERREWNKNDAYYWYKYNISSTLLDYYNIIPLSKYEVYRTSSDKEDEYLFKIEDKNIYGYFNSFGLYKIYRPLSNFKFTTIDANYIQGSEQLQGFSSLIIASSLKDLLTIKALPHIKIDVIAPNSESTILSKETIENYKKKYKAIVTLFDNDQTGIKSMNRYKDDYNIPFVYLSLEKDISDAVVYHGNSKVLYELVPKLERNLNLYKELH